MKYLEVLLFIEGFKKNNFLFRLWGNKSTWLSWIIRKLCHCKLPISWKVFCKDGRHVMIYLPSFSLITLILWYSSFKIFFVLAYLSAINVLGRMRLDIRNMQITTGQQFPAFHFPTTKKHIHKHERRL